MDNIYLVIRVVFTPFGIEPECQKCSPGAWYAHVKLFTQRLNI